MPPFLYIISLVIAILIPLDNTFLSISISTANAQDFGAPMASSSSSLETMPLDVLENIILPQLSGQDLYNLYMVSHPTRIKSILNPLMSSYKSKFLKDVSSSTNSHLQLNQYFHRVARNLSIDFAYQNPDWICSYAILKQFMEWKRSPPLEVSKSFMGVVNSRINRYMVGVDIRWKRGVIKPKPNPSVSNSTNSSWLPSWLRFWRQQPPIQQQQPRSTRSGRGFLKSLLPIASIEFGHLRTGLSLDIHHGSVFMHHLSHLNSKSFIYENMRNFKLVQNEIATLWIYVSQYTPSIEFLLDKSSVVEYKNRDDNRRFRRIAFTNTTLPPKRLSINDEANGVLFVGSLHKPDSIADKSPTRMKFGVEENEIDYEEYEDGGKPEVLVDNIRILYLDKRRFPQTPQLTRMDSDDSMDLNGFDDEVNESSSSHGFERWSVDGDLIRRRILRECRGL